MYPMKKRKEELLKIAIKVLQNSSVGIVASNEVPKEFNGYFAAFGASVMQSGLLQASVFYSKRGGADAEREKVPAAILAFLKEKEFKAQVPVAGNIQELWKYVQENHNAYERMLNDIMDAAAALKLALRTFPEQTKSSAKPQNEKSWAKT